jgi:hypothetical protein
MGINSGFKGLIYLETFNEPNHVTLNKTYPSEVKWCYFDILHVLRRTVLIIARFRHKGFAIVWDVTQKEMIIH